MSTRMNRIVAGAAGGMAGGIVMALALTALRQMASGRNSQSRSRLNGIRGALLTRTMPRSEQVDRQEIARRVAQSAFLGALYGGIRSGLNLPRFVFGPVFGLVTYGLSQVGLAPAVSEVPGPWNKSSMPFVPRMVTHTLYGVVTDTISERVENMLA